MMGGYVKTFLISNPHTLGQTIRLDGVKTLVSAERWCARHVHLPCPSQPQTRNMDGFDVSGYKMSVDDHARWSMVDKKFNVACPRIDFLARLGSLPKPFECHQAA